MYWFSMIAMVAADHARRASRPEDTQSDDHVDEAWTQRGHHGQDHDEAGEGLPRIHHPLHADVVRAPEIPAGDPDEGGQAVDDQNSGETDRN